MRDLFQKMSMVLAIVAATLPLAARAGTFTAGNLAVFRVGDGQPHSDFAAAPVFIDEYTPTGTLVQSIALPTTASGNQLALTSEYRSGEVSEGLLTVSTDGRYLVVPGYNSAPGTSFVVTSTVSGSTNERVIGRIDAAGNVDTSTGLGTLYSGGSLRGAASTDGQSIWASGSGAVNPGVNYTAFGSGTWTNVAGSNPAGIHSTIGLGIWGGQMFASTTTRNLPLAGMTDVYQVGTGTPTVGQATAQLLTGVSPAGGAPTAMVVFDLSDQIAGLDTLYYVDYGGDAFSKYSKQANGTWAYGGTLGAGSDDWGGLTGVVEGTDVRLYAVSRNNRLVSVLDSTGYNGNFSSSAQTILALAPTGTYFRGVAFAPSVPEPASAVLVSVGAVVLWLIRRRK